MSSPTQRSLDALRKDGWTCAVVERWNPYAKIRQDLFGCIDILAIKPGCGTLAVQACAGASHAARREKAINEPRLIVWLAASKDNKFEVWSWAKQGARGARKLWTLRREEITGVQVVNETQPEARAKVEAA
jgi:hypothetical protein